MSTRGGYGTMYRHTKPFFLVGPVQENWTMKNICGMDIGPIQKRTDYTGRYSPVLTLTDPRKEQERSRGELIVLFTRLLQSKTWSRAEAISVVYIAWIGF